MIHSTEQDEIRQQVRAAYGAVARADSACGCGPACCAPAGQSVAELVSRGIGYSVEELSAAPEGANLGLGCGNPLAIAALKPGGRLAISDIVLTAELPDDMKAEVALHTACVAGAANVDDLNAMLEAAGFRDIRIAPKDASREFIRHWAPGRGVENYIALASIEAVKPEYAK